MKKTLLLSFFYCVMSVVAYAQTEVNSLAELEKLPSGTPVKLLLNDVHTSASNYDYWVGTSSLYMQDQTAGVCFNGMQAIQSGKTLNGSIVAVTERNYGKMSLTVSSETNVSDVTETPWDFSGTPVTTIEMIEGGSLCYMLVTLTNVTSKPSDVSSYAVVLSDGKKTIDLYNDWDMVQLSKVPERIKSISALVMLDVWNGGYYLIPISQDLIKDADAPEDAKLVKSFEGLSDVEDGEDVLVTLSGVNTTAVLGDAVFMEDATGGTVFYGLDVAEDKVLNGSVYAFARKVGRDMCLRMNPDKTKLEDVVVTDGKKAASPVYLNGALASYWHNRLVVLSDIQSERNEGCWKLVQGDVEMNMKDVFGKLDGFEVPVYIKSLTGVVMYDAETDAYVIAPTSKDLIVTGEPPVEPNGIAKVKGMNNGDNFELLVENAQVTYAENGGTAGAFYIIEDETGGLMLQDFPDMGWVPGDRVTGAIYGALNRERADAYYTDVTAVANAETTESMDFEVTHGVLTPSVVTCAEAKASRYYSCYVKIENMHKANTTMSFMGSDIDYTAVNDGTATILFDDGWEVLPVEWQNFYGICQLPDDAVSVAGIIEPMFNYDFIYPLSEGDIATPTGIRDVMASVQKDAVIYTVTGLRVNQLQKGINIVNGKKVLVK